MPKPQKSDSKGVKVFTSFFIYNLIDAISSLGVEVINHQYRVLNKQVCEDQVIQTGFHLFVLKNILSWTMK